MTRVKFNKNRIRPLPRYPRRNKTSHQEKAQGTHQIVAEITIAATPRITEAVEPLHETANEPTIVVVELDGGAKQRRTEVSRNWGSEKNEARKAEGHIDDEQKLTAFEEGDEEAAAANDNNNEENKEEEIDEEALKAAEEEAERRRKEEEEEAKKMTYEEYLAKKSEEQKDSEAFRELEVKELENNEFAGVKPKVVHKGDDFLVMGGGKSLRKKGNKADKEATKIVPSFRVADSSSGKRDRRDGDRRGGDRRGGDRRSRGDRGDRRDGRGGRGGGDRRSGGYSNKKEIDVGDMNSFPSL